MTIIAHDAPEFRISVYAPRRRDGAAATTIVADWEGFRTWLSEPLDSVNKREQAWSPLAEIGSGKGARTDAGAASLLIFEYDADATPELLERCRALPYDAVIHTSASATEAVPKFRCVLRPSRPIANDAEYQACIAAIADALEVPPAPESRRTQLWYRPIRSCSVWTIAGEAFDVDDAIARYPAAPSRAAPQDVSRYEGPTDELARAALSTFRGGSFGAALIVARHAASFDVLREWIDAQGWDDPIDDETLRSKFERARSYGLGSALPIGTTRALPGGDVIVAAGRDALRAAMLEHATPGTTVFVIAGMGGGKTHNAITLAERSASALIVSPTQALALDWAARSSSVGSYRKGEAERVSTTLHSLLKFEQGRDLFIVDELPAVFDALHKPLKFDAVATFDAIVRGLSQGTAIALGADIDAELLEHFRSMLPPDRRVVVLRQDGAVLQREVVIVDVNRARSELLAADGKIAFVSTGKTELKIAATLLPGAGQLHGDTDRKMMADIDAWCRAHDVVCFNHAAGAGVSIAEPFDRVIGAHRTREVGPAGVVQLLGRLRNVSSPIVLGMPSWQHGNAPEDAETIRDAILERAAFADAGSPQALVHDARYLASRVLFEQRAARDWNRPWPAEALRAAGWRVTMDVQPGDRLPEWTSARKEVQEAEIASIVAAKPASVRGYERDKPSELHRRFVETFDRCDERLVRLGADYCDQVWRFVAWRDGDWDILQARDAARGDGRHEADASDETLRSVVAVTLIEGTYGAGLERAADLRDAVRASCIANADDLQRLGIVAPREGKEVAFLNGFVRYLGGRTKGDGRNVNRRYVVTWPGGEDLETIRSIVAGWRTPAPGHGRFSAIHRAGRRQFAPGDTEGESLRSVARRENTAPEAVALARGGRPAMLTAEEARAAVLQYGSNRAASEALGVSKDAIRRALAR